jgi:hypothetical protein
MACLISLRWIGPAGDLQFQLGEQSGLAAEGAAGGAFEFLDEGLEGGSAEFLLTHAGSATLEGTGSGGFPGTYASKLNHR